MGHVQNDTHERYYVGLGTMQEAVTHAIATVPNHHRAYAEVTKAQKLNGNAYLVTTKILGADDRKDPGVLREHLTKLAVNYPDATNAQDTVAERIATLLNDGTTADDVMADIYEDANNLDGIEDLINGAFEDLDPQVAAALDAQGA